MCGLLTMMMMMTSRSSTSISRTRKGYIKEKGRRIQGKTVMTKMTIRTMMRMEIGTQTTTTITITHNMTTLVTHLTKLGMFVHGHPQKTAIMSYKILTYKHNYTNQHFTSSTMVTINKQSSSPSLKFTRCSKLFSITLIQNTLKPSAAAVITPPYLFSSILKIRQFRKAVSL